MATPFVITELFAFIVTEDLGEGVPAMQLGSTMFPLIGADAARVADLRKMAQQVANDTGKPLTLARFSIREDLETIAPAGKGMP